MAMVRRPAGTPEPLWQVIARHWQHLTPAERARFRELMRKFKGRRSNLTAREQRELRDLAAKLDAPALARELYARRDSARGLLRRPR